MGRVLMTIVDDTSGRHDALCGQHQPAGQRGALRRRRRPRRRHPNARDLLALAAAKHGLGRRDLAPGVNLFKPVSASATTARCSFDGARRRRRHVELRAEVDVVVLRRQHPPPARRRGPTTPQADVRLHRLAGRPARPRSVPGDQPRARSGPSRTPTSYLAGAVAAMSDAGRPAGRRRRGGRGAGAVVARACARGRDAAHRRPRRQPGRRLPALRRRRPGRALLGGRHDRRPAQHLPRRRHACCCRTRARR